jgi:hypothetical protein
MTRLALVLCFLALQTAMVGTDGRFTLERSRDEVGIRSHGMIETLGDGRTKFYPLPQSTAAEYIRLRREDAKLNPFPPESYQRNEAIGPYQVEGDKIWFGKSYYDSEGLTGVGAFGYFDTSTRRYTLFTPPEMARYEVSAILMEADAVWLGLDQFVEDVSNIPGGLLRWDRKTHEVQRYPLEFVVDRIRRQVDALRLDTKNGYALLRDGNVQRFLKDGRPIGRFPPRPTKW